MRVRQSVPPIETQYLKREKTAELLGPVGKKVLLKVLNLVKTKAMTLKWPLTRIEVRHVSDVELSDWNYLRLILVFDCTFQDADDRLHELYEYLDQLVREMTAEEKDILHKLLFLDVDARTNF